MSFTIVPKPALNKDGYAKVTFKGYEEIAAQYDSDTGEEIKRAYVKLAFEIMDTTRKSPIKANIIGGAITGRFQTTLAVLGFELPEAASGEDSDGFRIEIAGQEGADGFEIEVIEEEQTLDLLREQLDSAVGVSLIAKVVKNKRGYWEIETDTFKPLPIK
ncbi:hypothetical protein [Calothrix sp. PCC 6303]|uniref:hypothetical protein n=1 Tax=Calothrix sp. PCC 6303 TaxID=1170562 RepID=UPI0002A02EC7|nr:hypothetical protein [Calothrix sp. PCC 6303]AFZ03008.1 hypothetical protein Cal6303_4092 [Calothrix sp. PCC 6303]